MLQPSPAHRRRETTRFVVLLVARAVLSTALGLVVWALVLLPFGFHGSITASGSMRPSISVGDVVVARPVSEDTELLGRVVVVEDPARPGELLTHRIVTDHDDGTYTTRGDANPSADAEPVTRDAVVGRGFLLVPWVGLPAHWLSTGDVVSLIALATGLGVLGLLARDPGAGRRTSARDDDEHPGGDGGGASARGWRAPHRPGSATSVTAAVAALVALVAPVALDRSSAAFTASTANDGNTVRTCDTLDHARFASVTTNDPVGVETNPEHAVDCSHDTAWVSPRNFAGHALTIDLGAMRTTRTANVLWEPGHAPTSFILAHSVDGSTWANIQVVHGTSDLDVIPIAPEHADARYWRLVITSLTEGLAIHDVGLYGTSPA